MHPRELAESLHGSPAIATAAEAGIPGRHPRQGLAAVVTGEPGTSAAEEEIRDLAMWRFAVHPCRRITCITGQFLTAPLARAWSERSRSRAADAPPARRAIGTARGIRLRAYPPMPNCWSRL